MNNLDAIFNELAENYNVSLEFIKDIYDLLKEKPFISEEDDRIFTCLEMIVQDESEKNNYLETKKESRDTRLSMGVPKTLQYSINDALYQVYGEDIASYLDDEYIEINQTRYGIKR